MLESMRRHAGEANAEAAMKAIRRVLPRLGSAAAAAQGEAVELIFRAMRMCAGRRLLQAAACSNVWNLLEAETESAQRALLARVADAGANEVVIVAVRTHASRFTCRTPFS